MPVNNLDDIAIRHGTDKSTAGTRKLSAKAYTVAYNNYLEAVKDEPIVMLEIGIWQGSSMRMWEEFLPNARLFAIDIDPSCKRHETERSKVFIGDQTNSTFLKRVAEAAGGSFNCIIDDGGHRMEHHQASLSVLWSHLKDGGWYAIEDLHTCYAPDFGGGYMNPNSTVERVLKPALDTMNYEEGPPPFVSNLGSMHVYPSVTFLFKGAPRPSPRRSAFAFLRR